MAVPVVPVEVAFGAPHLRAQLTVILGKRSRGATRRVRAVSREVAPRGAPAGRVPTHGLVPLVGEDREPCEPGAAEGEDRSGDE